MEHKKVTASDGVSNEMFGWIISISGYTLLVGSHGKMARRDPPISLSLQKMYSGMEERGLFLQYMQFP